MSQVLANGENGSTVLVGKLHDPDTLVSGEELKGWNYRAMWSFLRLQYKRNEIDAEISVAMDKKRVELGISVEKPRGILPRYYSQQVLRRIFMKYGSPEKPRELQFIMGRTGVIRAVATLQHLLLEPQKVYDAAKTLMDKNYPHLQPLNDFNLSGICYQLNDLNDMKIGLQIHAGTITTRQAVRVAILTRVEQCLNALSWLNIGSLNQFMGFGAGVGALEYERVLRIKKVSELIPRLQSAIISTLGKEGDVIAKVEAGKQVKVTPRTARVLLSAMGLSYSLGAKTIMQVLDQFKEEDHTQWGMSMAASWVAKHGSFKKRPEQQNRLATQKLSTMAAASLMIKNIPKARKFSLAWLKQHVKGGCVTTVEELLKGLV